MAYRRCPRCTSVFDLNSDHPWHGIEHPETCHALTNLIALITGHPLTGEPRHG